LYRVNGA